MPAEQFDGDVNVNGTVNTTHVSAQGNISALGNVNAGDTVNTKRVELSETLQLRGPGGGAGARLVRSVLKCQADDTVNVTHLSAEGNVNAGDTVNTKHVSAQGNISALGNVNAGNMNVTGDIRLTNAEDESMAELSLRQLAQALATIDARTAQMDRKLDDLKEALRALSSMTARMPDGRTLINVVGTILDEVQN
jgi:hypothetical protein